MNMFLNRYRLPLSLLATITTAYLLPSNFKQELMQSSLTQPSSERRIILHTTSTAISGPYSLYDLLSCSTQSGSISIDINPQPASSSDSSTPATLDLRSKSGSVYASLSEAFLAEHDRATTDRSTTPPPPYSSQLEPENNGDNKQVASAQYALSQNPRTNSAESGFPARNYITSVNAQSGSISGTYPLGTRTTLEVHSGSLSGVELVVMPSSSSGSGLGRQLRTAAYSGSQRVRIVDSGFWMATAEKTQWWDGLVARHESHSGSLDVEYPDSWEGTVEVEHGGGSVNLDGRGVEIVRQEQGWLVAKKGQGGGKVYVRASSGSVRLRFG